MPTNKLDAAFPAFDSDGDSTRIGLTKREYFAAMALKGLLANPSLNDEDSSYEPMPMIDAAVEAADLLIMRLNNEESNSEEQP